MPLMDDIALLCNWRLPMRIAAQFLAFVAFIVALRIVLSASFRTLWSRETMVVDTFAARILLVIWLYLVLSKCRLARDHRYVEDEGQCSGVDMKDLDEKVDDAEDLLGDRQG
ncbi:hypothetical protein B0T26DRAFT_706459 [Lasiosphaeria miniovina]|uniref:Uncharacterized protein n=1 Tax=Lasiosphaeria miniovina TaxID=1954250 RepID=A0AA40E3A5_9PEZI|nr:uncharacterized protein B0T26DRAFT_706459 [Lasiosphaeria miniovina]KAK0723457.1 hypothetical protein B0T26DRAFT_706459 [Lasiosphaeria miniovina]